MKLDDAQDRDAAAGEYVLGTLVADERDAFERALAGDAALQQAVYAWQDRLLGLAARVAPVAPPAGLWERIAMRTGPGPQTLAAPATATTSTSMTTAPRTEGQGGPIASERPAANEPLWQRLGLWRAVSGLAVAASLVLATLLVLRPGGSAGEPPARYLAVLQGPDKATGWIVEATAGQGVRLVPVGPALAVPPGKTMQFWTKAEGATGPTSLGLVQAGRPVDVPLAALPALGERQLFELTLEPSGGSPYNRPSGPILFVGSTVRI